MTVLIAGGGIGGLTLALSLHQIGVPARAFESVPELKPLGVGINVLPHAVREKLYPQEGPPIWNGRILWRGITAGDAFLTGRTMIMAGHEILKFVCYPISKAPDASGKHQINWVAERHMPPTYQWRREDYNRTAKLDEFLPWFKDSTFDWLDVPGLIRNCPQAYEYPLVDRDPVAQWTFGRVTLMGDAAHPMYPIGSNGASQAMRDARVLTREILNHGVTNAALAADEAARRPA